MAAAGVFGKLNLKDAREILVLNAPACRVHQPAPGAVNERCKFDNPQLRRCSIPPRLSQGLDPLSDWNGAK